MRFALPDDFARWRFPSQMGKGQHRPVAMGEEVGDGENAEYSRSSGGFLLIPDGCASVSLARVIIFLCG